MKIVQLNRPVLTKNLEPWRRNLYVIWLAQFIAMIGMNMVVPFLAFFVRELGVTTEADVIRWSGWVFSGPFFFSFFLTPIWGNLGDRYGRKLMLVRAIVGLAISQVLIGLSQNVQMLLLLRMLQGAISGFIPAALALVSANTPEERAGYALGVLQTATASGAVIGPVIGGPLADAVGYRWTFFIVAILCALAGLLVVALVEDEPVNTRERETWSALLSNYGYAFRSRSIRLALSLILICQMALLMVQPIFALYVELLEPNKEYIATAAGVIFSVAGVFMVVSSPWWGKRADAQGYRTNLALAITGAALSCIAQGLATDAYQLIVFRAVQGFCIGGTLPMLYSYVSRHSELTRRSGIMGIASSMTILANVAGPAAGGYLAAHIGLRANFLIAGGCLLAAALFVWQFLTEPDTTR
ncbi:MAG: MFS transporter [Acidobacteriota bacterium]|nr:MFS transporter [Blastocatellia bacterium]MDW8240665.1 MFS transporter [Acidobacteriota bacterium]